MSLIPLSAIQQRMADGVPTGRVDEATIRRLWWAALDTLQEDILSPMNLSTGLWLSAPLPALYEHRLLERLQGWVWAPDELESLGTPTAGLLPPSRVRSLQEQNSFRKVSYSRMPLRKCDGHDPLLIMLTPEVQVALALQGPEGKRNLLMRSDPETLRDILKMLNRRLDDEDPLQAKELRQALADLGQLHSNVGLQQVFWPLLSERLAGMAPSLTLQTLPESSSPGKQSKKEPNGELTLLEALTHEVRTPLATIRTLIRSLLRRKDLPELVLSRLKLIDSECTEQIDRFGLIFNAAELQRQQPEKSRLASTDLGRMLEMLRPSWSEQLHRRGVNLHLDIAPDLPQVLSDPERLELMLGGLIDRKTRGLKSGGSLLMKLRPAGQRLKLQILSKAPNAQDQVDLTELNSDLGPVLSWNPSTGSLQLSQAATQRLLASLGGRLTHRRDRGLTVFFPISDAQN